MDRWWPWLPWPPDPGTRNPEALRDDPTSILHLYRRLPALRCGDQTMLPPGTPDDVLA